MIRERDEPTAVPFWSCTNNTKHHFPIPRDRFFEVYFSSVHTRHSQIASMNSRDEYVWVLRTLSTVSCHLKRGNVKPVLKSCQPPGLGFDTVNGNSIDTLRSI